MQFGREDRLADALDVGAWPEFFNRSGKRIEPFENQGFSGSTRFVKYELAKDVVTLPELYESKEKCCGCSACLSACPKHAIAMFPDEEGFLYPVVDAALCVGCKACLRVCPLKD